MQTIWKFLFSPKSASLQMPAGAEIVRVSKQGDDHCIWAKVETSAQPVSRQIRIVGTGHEIPQGCVYVGTWDDGPFVWHLFEIRETKTIAFITF